MKKPSRPRNDPAFRDKLRDTVMGIGRRLVVDEGLASVQARRIATEAGCAVGSIYNVFHDLDALIIALNTVTLGELGSALKAAHDASKDAPTHERLLALAQAYFEFAGSNRQLWRAIFEHHLPEGAKAPPEYRDDQNRLFALVEDCLVDDIADAVERRSAARALFASVHGIVSLALDRKLGEFEPDETRKQIEFLVGCAARGLKVN
ncbi:MAG: TetR/AcrR family transcriptional regulator [Alphaproteobacteria bacterium]|nr:TetR/AcrR family transcriptional regulator [Alphaproteobacteria bacterium]